ncbi:Extracellular membrane protein CFEM domain [Penicillium cf. griseofulvum]|uniref:Extracellular membrane protein CFEM domain n=1 Tax=Penicillium cf. griseofulvum TaxID=2972120 RepID=A0A9W9IVF2_9EURO|nr:Extracellular membrane protein CFEM domain [Penicillium cf. griseofulvum]KAJ5430482.1 Extracellular membrane protein CFEM domain [Penicillium cf. griseofulvum]KAJ5435747.1 Extracellular membrane protein CFEM domain [Penicillium cf. griseofulvum]
MKFTITFALAALLTTATAQGLGDLPNCSKSCATGAIPANCGIDFKCICESKTFLNDMACCVADKCTKGDQELTIKVAQSICARGDVTDLPSEVVCSNSKSSSSSSTSTSASSNSTETGTKSSTEATAATKTENSTSLTSTNTATTTSDSASTTSSGAAAATSSGLGALTRKDSSLVAAAGAAAAFAILI